MTPDLNFLIDHWADLLEARLRGTPRPWSEPAASLERRAEADAKARAERLERSDVAPGERMAPLHIDVLDVIVDLVATADDLAERLAQHHGAVEAPLAASSAFSDPRPHLRLVGRLCGDLEADEDQVTAALLAHARAELRRLGDDVAAALGLIRDGQVLKALCPWCGGRTTDKPVGGGHTLRVRNRHDGPVIVCHGVGCEPPEADCGTWIHGRPAWPQHEWDWLAQRLEQVA